MSNLALETVIRDLKKATESFLRNEGPLNKIINACDRFLSLKGFACLDRIKRELKEALHEIGEYAEALKHLISDAGKHFN